MNLENAIVKNLRSITKTWTKQRKAEERRRNREINRRHTMVRGARLTILDVASEVMNDAYMKASSDGRYPAHARQIMYAARPAIQERTGEALNDQYFCQRLLPDYLAEVNKLQDPRILQPGQILLVPPLA